MLKKVSLYPQRGAAGAKGFILLRHDVGVQLSLDTDRAILTTLARNSRRGDEGQPLKGRFLTAVALYHDALGTSSVDPTKLHLLNVVVPRNALDYMRR